MSKTIDNIKSKWNALTKKEKITVVALAGLATVVALIVIF